MKPSGRRQGGTLPYTGLQIRCLPISPLRGRMVAGVRDKCGNEYASIIPGYIRRNIAMLTWVLEKEMLHYVLQSLSRCLALLLKTDYRIR